MVHMSPPDALHRYIPPCPLKTLTHTPIRSRSIASTCFLPYQYLLGLFWINIHNFIIHLSNQKEKFSPGQDLCNHTCEHFYFFFKFYVSPFALSLNAVTKEILASKGKINNIEMNNNAPLSRQDELGEKKREIEKIRRLKIQKVSRHNQQGYNKAWHWQPSCNGITDGPLKTPNLYGAAP